MIIERKDPWFNSAHLADAVHDVGNTDYVRNGEIVTGAPALSVLVSGQGDLGSLIEYEPGTVAYTAGFQSMWQKDVNNNWVSIT